MDNKWRIKSCNCIAGIDPLAIGSITGENPEECRNCNGSGRIWVRPSDHCFQYPGGPALGKSPGLYKESQPV